MQVAFVFNEVKSKNYCILLHFDFLLLTFLHLNYYGILKQIIWCKRKRKS